MKNNALKLRGFLIQCAAGIVAGFLNIALSLAAIKLHVPLFMDTLFTVTASCFGWTCGIVAAVSLHTLSFVVHGFMLQNLTFFFCSLTMVVCVRLMLFRKNALNTMEHGGSKPLRLLILAIVLALVISLEGGLFYYALISLTKYNIGNQAVNMLIYTFVTQNVPMLISATLARFPVNLVDKAAAVFGGYGIFALLQKAAARRKNSGGSKNENSFAFDSEMGGGIENAGEYDEI